MPKNKRDKAERNGVINPQSFNFNQILTQKMLMLSKRHESTEDDRRTWLHVPSGTQWSTSSEIYRNFHNAGCHGCLGENEATKRTKQISWDTFFGTVGSRI